MAKFMKNDVKDLKPLPHLIDVDFKEELAMLLTLGGLKYEYENWRKATKLDIVRYRDALERHLMQIDKGEIMDKDTGLPHAICIAFNSMALHYLHKKYGLDSNNRVQYRKRLKGYANAKV